MSSKNTSVYDSFLEFAGPENVINKLEPLLDFINDYFNRRSEALASRNIGKQIMWTDNDTSSYLSVFGVTQEDLTLWFKMSNIGSGIFKVLCERRSDIYFSVILTVFFYINDKKICELYPELTKNKKAYEYVLTLLVTQGLSYYQHKYFRYQTREDVWKKALDKLSYKYKYKLFQNNLQYINYYADLVSEGGKRLPVSGDDDSLSKFGQGILSHINASVKNLSKVYYSVHEAGERETEEKITKKYDESTKAVFETVDNVSSDISTITRRVTNSYIQDSVIDMKLVKVANPGNKLSPKVVENILGWIRFKDPDKYLFNIIDNICKYFIASKKYNVKDIKTAVYLKTMIEAYNVSHTKDPFIIEIKSTLNKILEVYGDEVKKYKGKTQLQLLRQCIYIYLVFYTAKHS